MEKDRGDAAFGRAQRGFSSDFFRSAFRFRGHYTTNRAWGKVLVWGSDFFLAHLTEEPYNRGKSFQGGRLIRGV